MKRATKHTLASPGHRQICFIIWNMGMFLSHSRGNHSNLPCRRVQNNAKYEYIYVILNKKIWRVNGNSHPVIIDLPVSQWIPVKPTVQEQLYPFTASVQLAPFRHGIPRHSSISAKLRRYNRTCKRYPHFCPLWEETMGHQWLSSYKDNQWCGASIFVVAVNLNK